MWSSEMDKPLFTPPRRSYTRCNRPRCRRPFSEHADGRCPDSPDRYYAYYPPKGPRRGRFSNSFTWAEADVAAKVIHGLLRRQDVSAIVKGKSFSLFAKKVLAMAERSRHARNGAA